MEADPPFTAIHKITGSKETIRLTNFLIAAMLPLEIKRTVENKIKIEVNSTSQKANEIM